MPFFPYTAPLNLGNFLLKMILKIVDVIVKKTDAECDLFENLKF